MTREDLSTWRSLTEHETDAFSQIVPGGAQHVQEVYPLSTLQEGLLFHRLMNEHSDSYLLSQLFRLQSPQSAEHLVAAIQIVIDRHDALRTAVMWQGISKPVQVVYRRAMLPVEHVRLSEMDRADLPGALMRPVKQRLPLDKAPLAKLRIISIEKSEELYGVLQVHHLVCDHRSLEIIVRELMVCLEGRANTLTPSIGYKEFIAIQSREREKAGKEEQFFKTQLGDLEECTAPFALLDVYGDGSELEEIRHVLDPDLHREIRRHVTKTGFTAARLFHSAWALVVARTSGRNDIVFGTVLSAIHNGRELLDQMLGMAVNTLPLRLKLNDVTARDLIRQVDRVLRMLLNHVHTPLTLAQRCSGNRGDAPLFTSLFNFRHASRQSYAGANTGHGVQSVARGEAWTNYPLTMTVDDRGETFEMTIQADRRIDARLVARYLETAMRSLLEAVERDAEVPVLQLPVIATKDLQWLRSFNGANSGYPHDKSLSALLEGQVARAPQSIAAIYQEEIVLYGELNARANRLARYLLRQGITVGDYVLVLMSRSLDLLVAQIALVKIGCAYVPLDAEAPAARQEFIARDCGAEFVLSQHGRPKWLEDEAIEVITTPDIAQAVERESSTNLELPVSSGSPAYVMYTSGSTGQPKGVVVCHSNVSRLAIRNGFAEIGSDDVLVHYSNPTFDASTFEVWGALLNGARVVVLPQPVVLESAQFSEALRRQKVNVLWMSVGLFNQYAEAIANVFPNLRYLMVGGDALDAETIRQVLKKNRPAVLMNAYGPTECTTFATMYPVQEVGEMERNIPIGKPVADSRLYILDQHLSPTPVGVVGEIYIGGSGVSLGYLNRPEMTTARFIADHLSENGGGRLYKTGDLGCWRADGAVQFVGRNDHQVKIRGFRVEPGEIEAQLLRHESIREALVVPRGGTAEKRRLVAYVTLQPAAGIEPRSVADVLRRYLKSALPEYMIPSVFVTVEKMPLTGNGKVDKRALPEPSADSYVREAYEAPQTELERELAAIWQDVLHVASVGRNDDFFDLGGHSLLAIQVAARINTAMLSQVAVREIFERRTLRELAGYISVQREARLLSALESGNEDVEQLLSRLSSMSEDGALELLNEIIAKGNT